MTMYIAELGNYEMNDHVVEYEPNRRIGWEPEAWRGHPNAAPEASRQARWGQRWSFELTPDGPDATIAGNLPWPGQLPAGAQQSLSARRRSRLGSSGCVASGPSGRRQTRPCGRATFGALTTRLFWRGARGRSWARALESR